MSEDLPDLAALLPSWQLAMRAERKSPATITSYSEGVLAFLRWAQAEGVDPQLIKTAVQAFTADLLDKGAQAATARSALRRFAAWWLTKAKSTPTRCWASNHGNSKGCRRLTDDQLRRLIQACAGKELAATKPSSG